MQVLPETVSCKAPRREPLRTYLAKMKTKALEKILKEPNVEFNEKNHTYTNKETGELYTGCTTISEAWDKSFFLGPWYAKEMYLAIRDKLGEVARLCQDNPEPAKTPKLIELLNWCKSAAKRKSEEAKEDGVQAHDWIEKSICVKIAGKGKRILLPKSASAKNAVKAFIGWAKLLDVKWLASEEVLASDEHKVAGTLDALAVIDGITYLVDFKTSGQISASYLLQCAGYDIMLHEMGLQVMGYLIVRIPKDGVAAETLTITDKEDMRFSRDTFLKQREAHRFYVYAENKLKENGKMKTDFVEAVLTK